MGVVTFVIFVTSYSVSQVVGVPPSPTSIVTDQLNSEFATVKNTIKVLSEQWEKWNTLFVTSLEPRISNTASLLASIDSNIHNLQERAHVWDTFQLHVAAWNDQLASLDRKMDIINKAQEKVLYLEGKINSVLLIEAKLDNTLKSVKDVEQGTKNILNVLDTKGTKTSHDLLFTEFTTRGVLTSIKMVEKKLDRLLLTHQNNLLKTNGNDKAKLHIKCNTPKIVEELLNDISAKVDIIFDGRNNERATTLDYDDEYIEVNEGSGDVGNMMQRNGRNIKRTNGKNRQVSKQLIPLLEDLSNRTMHVETSMALLAEKQIACYPQDYILKLFYIMTNHSTEVTNNLNTMIGSYLREERAHIETIIERNVRKCCDHTTEVRLFPVITPLPGTTSSTTPQSAALPDVTPNENDYYDIIQPTWKPIHNENKSSCEDLSLEDMGGVYIFDSQSGKKLDISYTKRYCDIKNDGFWTIIQRRDNYTKQHNFNNTWEEYKYGFGDLHKDFWMGNEFLHSLSKKYRLVLKIELEDFDNKMAWAEYSTFSVASEAENYKLTVGGYSGNASDSFSSHSGHEFSTYDKKNDEAPECCPCAVSYGGGWWFNRCFESNLNGVYYKKPDGNSYFKGIIWEHWLGNYSLKRSVMKVKSRGRVFTEQTIPDVAVPNIPLYEDP